MADPSVLIVGAGPTGLVLALWRTKQGVSVRIIDKTAEPGTASRALAVHARTLELYEQLGLAEPVVAKGYTVPGFRLWIGGREAARVPFEEIVSDLTPYGFLHIFPQDEHERLLIDRLQDFGVQVERSTELLGYSDEGDHIGARLRGPDGAESTATAAFIAGCEARSRKSGRSWVRAFPVGPIRRSPRFSGALVPPFRDLYQQGEWHRTAAGPQRQGLSTRRLTIEDAFVPELMDT
jgi:2-polyprenyl-6-methoxyphenol hydroxylase-like FAD-dependent oxidoreductase